MLGGRSGIHAHHHWQECDPLTASPHTLSIDLLGTRETNGQTALVPHLGMGGSSSDSNETLVVHAPRPQCLVPLVPRGHKPTAPNG